LKLVLENRAWERRIIVETGEEFEGFTSFEAYIKANPPRGLGASPELIEKLIGNDTQLYQDFHAALRRPAHIHTKQSDIDNINISKVPSGTSKAYALQKLSDAGHVELLVAMLLQLHHPLQHCH